VRPRACSSGG